MPDACPFCVVDPSRLVFETEAIRAIWDAFPVCDGHLLIVTRRHTADWFTASVQERQAILDAIDRGRQTIVERFAPDGFNIGINIGESAGQTVPHLHLHLIPRYRGDVPDPLGGVRNVIPHRGNYLRTATSQFAVLEGTVTDSLLVKGADDPLFPHLRACFDRALSADFAVAFIQRSGVLMLREHIRDLLDRGGQVRIVTGDYLDVTDPDALVELLDLDGNLQLRMFEVGTTSFHPKAYIFHHSDGGGTAFVGSSNMTQTALRAGVEWNYRVLRTDAEQGFGEIVGAFETLFTHPSCRQVDEAWVAAYRRRRQPLVQQPIVDVIVEPPAAVPKPHQIQREALDALVATRSAGNEAGLVVLATGLGKTWLAAFDSAREEFRRVLFVAHREEILAQAMQTFRCIRPLARLGRYTGAEKAIDADVLFASVQTLSRVQHLERFPPDRFDYVVVDEFHHAAARTYRKLIDHFTPRFLLGLTATPERTDGGDLLALCQENLVYRKDLVVGIELGLLCPFQYFGVPDDVDYQNIPWRSTRFDEVELTNAVATKRRAQNALEQFRLRGGRRTLGFCCSQRHADFMAEYFEQSGVRAVAVHSGERSAPRATALEALAEGRLDVIFAVDMFNEGLDVPAIDTVLMLRPTESAIMWMQQFGRGLRCAPGKPHLTVIDYIGNHRSFLVKVRAMLQPLLGAAESDAEISAALRLLQQDRADLPAGCSVTYELEAIAIIQALLRTRASDDAVVAFYEDFRQRHGVRPTASELYHSGYNPRSLRRSHGSWTKFIRTMGDLTDDDLEVVDSIGEFLDAIETTPMTKSFKMLTLLAMLERDELPGDFGIDDLTQEFRRVARRSERLRDDVGDALADDGQLRQLIEQNPIEAWCGGRGTGGKSFFAFDGQRLRTEFLVPSTGRQSCQELVRELVDWRLAEYLGRPTGSASSGFVCRVIHADGKPIIKLPDRAKTPGIPVGETELLINNQPYVASFASQFVNWARPAQDAARNALPDILRAWFGPDAGRPGTRFDVAFEASGDGLAMTPVGQSPASGGAEKWRHYMREQIPPLFGLKFSTGNWNQGVVRAGKHMFLLVTLEKGSLNQDHRYEDRFLSPDRFQWQSQNQTTRDSKPGQQIKAHRAEGIEVHLLIRRHKVLDGKAAPFVYCGPVDFVDWHGDSPITVEWRLRDAVPVELRTVLAVPDSR